MVGPERTLAMKLGFALPISRARCQWRRRPERVCRGLEDLGYDTLWVGDRLVTPVDMHSTYPGKEQPHPPQMTRYLDPMLLWDGRRDGAGSVPCGEVAGLGRRAGPGDER
jgi:hypothetical protein